MQLQAAGVDIDAGRLRSATQPVIRPSFFVARVPTRRPCSWFVTVVREP
jgi:hypothetical protein